GSEDLIRALTSVPHDARGWDYTDAFGLAVSGLPQQAAPQTAIQDPSQAGVNRKRAVSYAIKVGAVDPRLPTVTHRGPSVTWSTSGPRGVGRRHVARSYAVRMDG